MSVKVGGRVLITGCGTGDDINSFLSLSNKFNLDLSIVAQDISRDMIYYSAKRFSEYNLKDIRFDVSSATNLPYLSDTFDIVFHFGGINTMSDTKKQLMR